MNRSSLRMKQYRPVSADFTKISGSLSSMFANDNEKPPSNNVLLITYKKSVTEIDGSPPHTPSSPFIRSFTGSQLDNKDVPIIENCNGNTEDCLKEEYDDEKVENNAKKNNKLELFKSLSSAESWESEDDCPPLASEDSDLGDPGEFESFSGTEDDDEEDDNVSMSVSTKSDESSFLKRRSLREKLKDTRSWSLRRSSEKELSPNLLNTSTSTINSSGNESFSESRLSRLFSLRRSIGPGSGVERSEQCMPRLAEEDEGVLGTKEDLRSCPPSLPPTPLYLTAEQTKRRHIVNSLVHSENNYLTTLKRLVNDYKVPLEESSPPVLSQAKVDILFHRVKDILHCHTQFRTALTAAVQKWDKEEKIGDVFVSCFSKSLVLEVYSDYINNFNQAMELAKSESKRKSAFADFLKVKQITAADRLNFFGLMVKPIQRFPQFILLLQDLLKETPQGHKDRMALQLALTTLESLAVMLNERKRESEQAAAFHAKLRSTGSKLGKSEHARVLLREDDVQQLEFNSFGQVSRSKPRRLLLLNDQVVCAAVSGRASEVEIGPGLGGAGERLNLKWAAGVEEVELVEGSAVGTLARLTVAGSVSSSSKRSSLGRSITPASLHQFSGADSGQAENLAQDMADLMHDFDVVSRISSMIGTLKCPYPGLTTDTTSEILSQIQSSIRQKDEEMSWLDKSCLHLAVKKKDKVETITFQMRSPSVKDDWVVEHRLSRLALDTNNSPGWDSLDQAKNTGHTGTAKLPLFVKNVVAHQCPEETQTEIMCGTSYTLLVQTPTRTLRPVTYVWVNATDGKSSHLRIYSAQTTQQINLKELGTILLSSCCVRSTIFVPGTNSGVATQTPDEPLKSDLVWVATDDRRILFYAAADPERGSEIGRIVLPSDPVSLVYHLGQVWVGMTNGTVSVYRRGPGGIWDTQNATSLLLGAEAVTVLLPTANALYATTGKRVMMVDAWNNSIVKSFTVACSETQLNGSMMSLEAFAAPGNISQMAVAGVGLWVALANSSIIALYHTESFIHMQDIDIAHNVSRVLAARDVATNRRSIYVTALSAAKGLLWIGTNVGIALTIPLPRLEGVPIVSGRANISYHAHFGPVRMFLSLNPNVNTSVEPTHLPTRRNTSNLSDHTTIEEEPCDLRPSLRKQVSDGHLLAGSGPGAPNLSKQYSSPMLGTRRPREMQKEVNPANSRRASKTLPRGFSLSQAMADGSDSVYGLYGDLLNVRDYECDSTDLGRACQENHKSDPELDTIQYRVSTLDRRVTMKSQRPRSLDLSSWSVESRASSHTTSSSDTCSEYASPSVSRNASFVSNRSTFACNEPPSVRRRMSCKKPQPKPECPQKTVTTLMGGRGYIQWRAAHVERRKTSHLAQINNNDAYLVIWDHKL